MIMSGVPKQFDKERVLSKALEKFWANGFEGTSMQDLVNVMGINRASMYTTFGNKTELFNRAFDNYCAASLDNIKSILRSPGLAVDNLEQFFGVLTSSSDSSISHGCFVNNAAVELGPHDAEIAEKIRLFWTQIQTELEALLERGINQQELAADTDANSLAALLNVVLQGLSAMSKAGVSSKQSQQSVQQLLALLPRV